MAFWVISIADGLAPADRDRAIANGPPLMESDGDYQSMLARTGWTVVEHEDVTPGFLAATERQLATRDGREEKWVARIAVLKDGLLRRDCFVVTAARHGA
jgi:hypothetical protein